MLNSIRTLNTFLGLIMALAVLAAISYVAWAFYQSHYADQFALDEAQRTLAQKEEEILSLSNQIKERDERLEAKDEKIGNLNLEIGQLNEEVARQKVEIERLDLALRLLKVDHRLARIEVLRQEGSAADGDLATVFSFVEIDEEGRPRETPREFRVEGDVVYIDSWVVKFTDEYVEQGDPLRSTSICLFRRVFGENQKPTEGFLLDPEGAGPTAYRTGGKPSDFERQLWSRFWDYANDPAAAAEAGVRAAHGEAPFVKLKPGHRYQIELRASGGLSIIPQETPSTVVPTT